MWIFKVAVKVFGGRFHSWSGESSEPSGTWSEDTWTMAPAREAPEQAHGFKHEEQL